MGLSDKDINDKDIPPRPFITHISIDPMRACHSDPHDKEGDKLKCLCGTEFPPEILKEWERLSLEHVHNIPAPRDFELGDELAEAVSKLRAGIPTGRVRRPR